MKSARFFPLFSFFVGVWKLRAYLALMCLEMSAVGDDTCAWRRNVVFFNWFKAGMTWFACESLLLMELCLSPSAEYHFSHFSLRYFGPLTIWITFKLIHNFTCTWTGYLKPICIWEMTPFCCCTREFLGTLAFSVNGMVVFGTKFSCH